MTTTYAPDKGQNPLILIPTILVRTRIDGRVFTYVKTPLYRLSF